MPNGTLLHPRLSCTIAVVWARLATEANQDNHPVHITLNKARSSVSSYLVCSSVSQHIYALRHASCLA